MDIIKCIQSRRSVRKFTDEPIPWETIEAIVKAASYSPTWKNSQTIRYSITDNPELIENLAANGVFGLEHNAGIIRRCKALAIQSVVKGICGYNSDGSFTTNKGDSWEMYDAGISAQTFCLAAHSYGVGSVIMGIYDENAVASIIKLPDGERVTALIALGYPAAPSNMPPRKDVDEILRKL